MRRFGWWCVVVAAGLIGWISPTSAAGQLIINEVKQTDEDDFLADGFNEGTGEIENPYEGYDYGIVPHSGNNNSPAAAVNPGNPYPEDLDFDTPGNQTTLPNGWNPSMGWGRIEGNGGDWFELVVTEDHTDLRGYTLYWENDETTTPGNVVGATPEDRGFIKFTQDKSFANLRAGTIITLSEDNQVREIRDAYPAGPPARISGAPAPHDTGHVYDLSTDLSFDPFGSSDWTIHYHVDEDITKGDPEDDIDPAPTQYFEALSDVKGHNRNWRMRIFNATNTLLSTQVETNVDRSALDLTTGMVQDFIGEQGAGYGSAVPGGAGGVGGDEMLGMRGAPVTGANSSTFEDLDWSSFGLPNVFNLALPGQPSVQDDARLGGVQDFSGLRNPVLANTFNWSAGGTADFGTAANWQNAGSGAVAGTGPQAAWTAQLHSNNGANVAQLAADATVSFATVAAASGTMTLEVQDGATLTVQNGAVVPGRVLVMDGGILKVAGSVAAAQVESFEGGKVGGAGSIVGNLINSGGAVAPGGSTGTLTVTGNYTQLAGPVGSVGGDYNGDGIVNAADYTVWRDNLGPGSLLNEGLNISPGEVNRDDYQYWKQQFGQTASNSGLLLEIAGGDAGQFDVLSVTGVASLAGALHVSLQGGFTPAINQMFTVLTASSVSSSLMLAGPSADAFELIANPTSLVLKYVGGGGGGLAGNHILGVPEPATAWLVGIAALFAASRRGLSRRTPS